MEDGTEIAIDGSGRLVIPKPVRDRLGLRAGSKLTLVEREGVLEVRLEPVNAAVVMQRGVAVIVPGESTGTVTADEVRRLIEADRSQRAEAHGRIRR